MFIASGVLFQIFCFYPATALQPRIPHSLPHNHELVPTPYINPDSLEADLHQAMHPHRDSSSGNSSASHSPHSSDSSPPSNRSGHLPLPNMTHSSTAHSAHHRSQHPSYSAFATSSQIYDSPISSFNAPLYSPPAVMQQFQPEETKPMFAGYAQNGHAMAGSSTEAQLRQQIQQLQAQVDGLMQERQRFYAQADASGFPPGSHYTRPQFQEEWSRRTDARCKLICASNRAGNALCAWHDSRRERRTYPPRMAPPGMLNCGCSEEEALFEESLARNGVGSYRPSGDQVRMDPGLRRPLLQLLKARYGYKDGDFEIDRRTGTWKEGEDHREWENRLRTARRP